MPPAVVIDTNVLVVANGEHVAGIECISECVDALRVARERTVLIDDAHRIFRQYRTYCSHSGQPGVGDAFFKWLWDNQANVAHCITVQLTPSDQHEVNFTEYPADEELSMFDPSDRVFVAVAVASGRDAEILNATDTDWWHARAALERNGVVVRFLCPDLMH